MYRSYPRVFLGSELFEIISKIILLIFCAWKYVRKFQALFVKIRLLYQISLDGIHTEKPSINNHMQIITSTINHTSGIVLRGSAILSISAEEKHLHISHLFKLFAPRGKSYTLYIFIYPHCLTSKQSLDPNLIRIRTATQIPFKLENWFKT